MDDARSDRRARLISLQAVRRRGRSAWMPVLVGRQEQKFKGFGFYKYPYFKAKLLTSTARIVRIRYMLGIRPRNVASCTIDTLPDDVVEELFSIRWDE